MSTQTAMGGRAYDPVEFASAKATARARALSTGVLDFSYGDSRGSSGVGRVGGMQRWQRLEDDLFARTHGQQTYSEYLRSRGLTDPDDPGNSSRGSGSGGSNSGSNVPSGNDDASLDRNIARAKDLATWNLGLSRQQMENAFGFRDREANRDFGFQRTLQGDRYGAEQRLEDTRQTGDTSRLGMSLRSQESLENLRQTGVSTRQTEQLKNQRDMQENQFNNQRLTQAIQAARARSGFTRRGGF